MSDKIISVNTQGFFEDDINDFANIHKPMALVTNGHMRKNLKDLDNIDGYHLAAGYPAKSGQRGVGIHVRNDVDYFKRPDMDRHARNGEFEVASVEFPSKNVVLTGLYRSPKSRTTDFVEKLDKFTRKTSKEPQRHVIAGDFNIDSRKNTETKRLLKEKELKFNLRSSTHEKGSCLDNFVTDFQPERSRVMRAKRDLISDHNPIVMHL